MKEYAWDFDRDAELWGNDTHNTIKECLADARETQKEDGEDNETVYIGEVNPFVPSVDAGTVLDQLEEDAYEFVGEAADDWHAYDSHKREELDELSDSLTNVVNEWLKKHGYAPSFYVIENIKSYPLNGKERSKC